MKRTRLIQLLLAVLVVFGSASGCRGVPPPSVVDDVALGASRWADEALSLAKQAQQHADDAARANQIDEYLALRAQANRAAQEAQEAAQKAQSLKNQIDDPATLTKLDQASADASQAINRLRLFTYQAKVDEISTRISEGIPSEYRDIAKKVVTTVFCATLSQRLAGPLPENAEIEGTLRLQAIISGDDPAHYAGIIAESIRAEAEELAANLQREEDAQNYMKACEELVGLF